MTQHGTNAPLLFARNGANRPLHQDRQVLRASDLALEQATQDAMLARARRHLHGWGVVGGLVPEVAEREKLVIGPGYGVTPLGDEVFLPEPTVLPEIAAAVLQCCGPGPAGCDFVDAREARRAHEAVAREEVTAWLIARPASREAGLRPGVPVGCAHPAASLLPSRSCGGVEFAILCTLPPSHRPQTPECAALMPFVCGESGAPPAPLPWAAPLEPGANFLVITELAIRDQRLIADAGARRTLWPAALMQEWIRACLCPAMIKTRPPNDDSDKPETPAGGGDAGVPPVVVVAGPVGALATLVRAAGPQDTPVALPPEEVVKLRDRLSDSVTDISGVGEARTAALAKVGVTTEGGFLATPTDRLATALNLPEAHVTDMKRALNTRHRLGLTFG